MKVRHAEVEGSLAGTPHGGLNDPSRLTWQVREILILDRSVCCSSIPLSAQVVISGVLTSVHSNIHVLCIVYVSRLMLIVAEHNMGIIAS